MKPYIEEAVRLISAYYMKYVDGATDQFAQDLLASVSNAEDTAPEEDVQNMYTVCYQAFGRETGDVMQRILEMLRDDIAARRYAFTDPDCLMKQDEIAKEVIRVENQRNAVLVLARIGRKGKPTYYYQHEAAHKSCQSYAKGYLRVLDPYDRIERPEAPPWRVWHKRNFERDEYIYTAHTVEKKSLAEIARELDVTYATVAKCFHRVEREKRNPGNISSRPERVAKDDLCIVSVTIEWIKRGDMHQVYDVAKEITSLSRQNNLLKTGQYNALGNPFILHEIPLTEEEAALVFEMAGAALLESAGKDYCEEVMDGSSWHITVTFNNMKKHTIYGTTTAPSAAQELQTWLNGKFLESGYKGVACLLGC